MTLLYHGTNGRWLPAILRNGLRPRANTARNNWKHVPHQSNPRCVYLTDSYAPYFAFNASRGNDPLCAVVEVDTDRLDQANLFPDEDFLEQAGRTGNGDGVPGTMSERTLHYRARQFEYNHTLPNGQRPWELSLQHLGTAAHRGPIPPVAITRAVVWPHSVNFYLTFVWDPSITIMNQRVCGDRYRSLTTKLFDGDFTQHDEITQESQMIAAMDPAGAILPPIEDWRLIDLAAERRAA